MSEEKLDLEEIKENVENYLKVLDMDLVMNNFTEIYKRIEGNVDSPLFELGEMLGVIKGYMKLINNISKMHNIDNKEIITEMIKNLDLVSDVLISFGRNGKNNLDINLRKNAEQRMLTFTDAVMELLEDILRK
jgi:hypothetical protein